MSALCKAYPTYEAASSAVGSLRAVGVDGDRIRVLMLVLVRDADEDAARVQKVLDDAA